MSVEERKKVGQGELVNVKIPCFRSCAVAGALFRSQAFGALPKRRVLNLVHSIAPWVPLREFGFEVSSSICWRYKAPPASSPISRSEFDLTAFPAQGLAKVAPEGLDRRLLISERWGFG